MKTDKTSVRGSAGRRVGQVALLLVLQHASMTVHAGPLDWLRGLFGEPAPTPERVIGGLGGPVPLQPAKSVRIRIDADTPTAQLPDGVSHYRRFTLTSALPAALVKVRVLTQRHESSPRFTAFAPQLHMLDEDGNIRASVSIRPLHLVIEPFQRAELRACVRVENLHSFLLAADVDKAGDTYQYNARTRGSGSPLNVYLTYTEVGALKLRVIPVDEKHPRCTQWQG